METKKYPKVNVRVIKAQSHESDSVIAKADFSTQTTAEESRNASDWIEPPFMMQGLKRLVTESSILPQCIRAYKNNIPGYGIAVR